MAAGNGLKSTGSLGRGCVCCRRIHVMSQHGLSGGPLEGAPTDEAHAPDIVWKPRDGIAVRIVGAGAYVPAHVVTAKAIASAIPGWPAERIIERTGIVERRYLWPLDVEQGRTVRAPHHAEGDSAVSTATDMAEVALTHALRMSGLPARDIEALVVVTCTPDRPRFSHDAMSLQRRLGLRPNAHCFVVDSGCGGSLYMLDMLARTLEAGGARTAAIVGTNFTSPWIDRCVYAADGPIGADGKRVSPFLSPYVFGDGAGAIVVRRDQGSGLGIRASIAGNDCHDLVLCPGGGALSPSYGERYRAIDHAFIVNGRLVMSTYLQTMARCMRTVTTEIECSLDGVERFYLHQPNERVLRALVDRMGLHGDRVASNVAWVGNTSSAGMFMLLADDLEQGRVALGSGTPVVFAAIGAGVHYGAQVVNL
jgi:3-oxoacyl-[acyl-carrier-protein] synthase III